ncbi:MAG: hypothetical protein ACL7BU_15835, partial [Candidatus Phlomobacter fragariae]
NGRFSGIKNNLLEPSLGDGIQILIAEQFIPFITEKTLKILSSLTIPKYLVYAGYLKVRKNKISC